MTEAGISKDSYFGASDIYSGVSKPKHSMQASRFHNADEIYADDPAVVGKIGKKIRRKMETLGNVDENAVHDFSDGGYNQGNFSGDALDDPSKAGQYVARKGWARIFF